tara:strand:- start:1299 stop:3260 length:1962 start_codon:yes stop_codon:yes gene_type:complete
MFEVDSVTGAVTIGNPDIPGSEVHINSTIKLKGGCGTLKSEIITATGTDGSSYLTGISADDVAKVEVGDVVRVDPSTIGTLVEIATNYVTEVTPDGNNSTIRLRDSLQGGYTLTAVQWFITQNETLTLTNGSAQENFNVDSCTGVVTIGNHIRRVDATEFYPTSRTPVESTSDWSSIKDDVRVWSYWQDPLTQNLGKYATIRAAVTAHGTYDWNIPVNGLPVAAGAFEIGDIIMVGSPTMFATSPAPGLYELLVVRAIDDTAGAEILICDGAQEGTTAPSSSVYNVNDVVWGVRKHSETSRLIDIEPRTRTTTNDYLSIILDRGYIVQSRLDYIQYIRFENISTGANTWFKVNSNMEGTVHKPSGMRENQTFGTLGYGSGGLELGGDLNMIGGDVRIFDSVNKSLLLKFENDHGHAEHLGVLQIDAGIVAKGDLYMYGATCPETVFNTPLSCTTTFSVNGTGDVTAGKSFEVVGLPNANPSTGTEVFKVGNLGVAGSNELTVKHTGEIASFGQDPFWTKSGGIHTRYVSNGSDAADKILEPNIIYLTNTTNTATLILTLPQSPITGDVVRVVDVSGNLDYQTSLVIRAPGTGVNVQGDNTGTTLGGLGSAYPSGELVVQTANAGFALIYLGSVASNGQVGIPTTDQGWWLLEV